MKVSIKIILWLSAKLSGDNMIDEGKTMNVQAHIDRHPIRSLLRSQREESQDGESWKEKKNKVPYIWWRERSGVQYARDGQKRKENRMKAKKNDDRQDEKWIRN